MSARFTLSLLLLAAMTAAGCEREWRRFSEKPPGEMPADATSVSPLVPGAEAPPVGTRTQYIENGWAIGEGRRLFVQMNCSGCHANGGGGMGPALMDHRWIYGSDPDQIHATILQGRPNGMPSFRQRLTEQQAWQLTAFVRSLSGLAPKDASGGRQDHMSAKPAENMTPERPPRWTGSPP